MTVQRLNEIADKYVEENENSAVMPDCALEQIKEAFKEGYRNAQKDILNAIQEPLSMLPF